MAREGAFDDIDAALTWHPSSINASMTGSLLANILASFRFHGTASHAGAFPQNGRSALDAVELMDIGANYLREHMEMTDRIHYAITDTGGHSPNVVQADAEVVYLMRSRTNESAQSLFARVIDIAKGAEAVINDTGLLPEFDMQIRRELNRTHPMGDFIIPFEPKDVLICASSDMGDVSRIAPLLQLQTACFALGTQPHSRLLVAQGLSSYAVKGTLFAADVLAEAVKTLLEDPGLVARAKSENVRRNGGISYTCPIPDEVRPPLKMPRV